MQSSYNPNDVQLLLKDITGLVQPQETAERERLIQSGRHYCEMLPIEYSPSETYMQTYRAVLELFAQPTARAVGVLADKIMAQKGSAVVLVSLARAGIPIGILLKRYLAWKYQVDVPHYAISIIRGKGIDQNAMRFLLQRYAPERIVFVDGWIGKGAILQELKQALADFPAVSAQLAVLADPANITDLCGTHEDLLIPSSCLNCTVSGLISRTFLRSDIIGAKDFHGAVYYSNLREQDLSYPFIDAIAAQFQAENAASDIVLQQQGIDEVRAIGRHFQIRNIHFIKPGIGETTRVLLRRMPWKVLIKETCKDEASLAPLLRLAAEKQVDVQYFPLQNYKACGIIKNLGDV